ncbi:hypothetical protein SAMN05216360_12155 [Methylobacterium phyllostachyos]|uniref:Uncharacterized protein n=1 Tax=Methylobacterium phyllostachyos TaxID=582672 RepID=A0A1H0J5A1_9HYPH|nr:hypothetical protein [Methylobacterium phyllostachyos]SDO38926.1 hypothetical protein SAMN05216360_12155 [Methylobacterium phyllostachyos]
MTRGSLPPLALAALSLVLAGPAAAQTVAPDQTGTGSGPGSTITAPYTNQYGVTKPPGTSMGPGEVPSHQQQRRERALTNKIDNSICDGCN